MTNDLSDRLRAALAKGEGESLEFKRSFDEEARQTICAFANTRGGELWIGVADDRTVGGASVGHEALRDWANQIAQALGIHPSLDTEVGEGRVVVRIEVAESAFKPVWYRGRAYVRSGSTTRLATDEEVARWVLERVGQTWDEQPEPRARWDDLDTRQVARFRRLCQQKGRRSIPEDEDDKTVLRKLGLLVDGTPTRGAVLLFGIEPQRFYPSARIKIGRFRSETLIVDDREVLGTLFDQVDGTMGYFKEHLQTRFEFRGEPAREVIWEYPLEALREAVINAVCHRDYLDIGHTQVRWYDDRLVILNPGQLPPMLRLEDLKRPHRSFPRNRKIAEMFFYAGWVEQWGSGIQKILAACASEGLAEPDFEETQAAFWLTLRKNPLTTDYLRSLGLNDRQVKAVMFVKEKGSITNREYRELNGVSNKTAYSELADLARRTILVKADAGRLLRYVLAPKVAR